MRTFPRADPAAAAAPTPAGAPTAAARGLHGLPTYASLYDCIDKAGLTTLKTAIDAAGMNKYFSDPKLKVTLVAPDNLSWEAMFRDCTDKTVKPVNKPVACSLAELLANKDKLVEVRGGRPSRTAHSLPLGRRRGAGPQPVSRPPAAPGLPRSCSSTTSCRAWCGRRRTRACSRLATSSPRSRRWRARSCGCVCALCFLFTLRPRPRRAGGPGLGAGAGM